MNNVTVNAGGALSIGDTAGNPGELDTGNMTVSAGGGPGNALTINTEGVVQISALGNLFGSVAVSGVLEEEGNAFGQSSLNLGGPGVVNAGGYIDGLAGSSVVFTPGSTWAVAAGGSLHGGRYFVFAPLTIMGSVGYSDLDMQVGSATVPSGSLVGPGNLSQFAELQWFAGALGLGGGISDGGVGKVEVQGSAAKTLATTLTLSSDFATLGGTGTITLAAGSSIINEAGDTVPTTTVATSLAGPGTFVNDGTLSFDPSAGPITFGCPIASGSFGGIASTIEIESGKGTSPVTFTGGGTLSGDLTPNDGTIIFGGAAGTVYTVPANLDTQWSASDALSIAAGTTLSIAAGASADFDHLTLAGTVTGAGEFSVNSDGLHEDDSLTWTASSMAGTGTTLIGGNGDYVGAKMTLAGPAGTSLSMGGRTLENKGKLVVDSGNVLILPSATLTNSGELDVLAGGAMSTASGVTVDNDSHGVINVSGAASLTSPTLDNENKITVAAGGTLTVSGGTMTNGSSATFTTSGASTLTGVPLNNEGQVNVSSGATLALSGGKLTNDQQVVDDGSLTLSGGSTIDNEGGTTVGGTIGFGGSRNGSEDFLNNGTLFLDGTSASPAINVPFLSGSNNGLPSVINMLVGSTHAANLSDGGTLSGNLNLYGGSLVVGGSFSVPATLTDNYSAGDLVTVGNGATLNIATGVTADLHHVSLSGTLTGAGQLSVNSSGQHNDDFINWSGGTMSGTGITLIGGSTQNGQTTGATMTVSAPVSLSGRTLVNNGFTTVNAGDTITASGNAVIDNVGVFTLAGSIAAGNGSSGTFENNNTLTFDGSSASPVLGIPIQSGSLGGVPSTVTMKAGSTHAASITGGGTLSGTLALNGGTLNLNGGTLTVNGNLQTQWSSGDLVNVTGMTTLTINSGVSADFDHLAFSSGTISGAGTLSIGADGQHSDDSLSWTGGMMTGTGTTLIGGVSTLTISGGTLDSRTLENKGVATIQGNGLSLSDSLHAGGPFLVNDAGAVFNVNAWNTQGTNVGVFTNNGTLAVAAGVQPRLQTFTQGSGGKLVLHIGGNGMPSAAELHAAGLATLAGEIDVVLDNGVQVPSGMTFTLVQGGSRSGTFATVNVPSGWQLQYTSSGVQVKSA